MTECLGLFAKYWEPGQVKTRLAASLGAERAAEVYRHFLVTLLGRLADCRAEKCLAYTPASRVGEFREIAPEGWQLELQAEGDLGERMEAFFASRFAAGFERVVLVGSDSPQLPLAAIQQAFEQLHESQVVLGPTEDGGYWLVGAAGGTPDIFRGIPWSTPQVWEATSRALQTANLRHSTLRVCYDVDNGDDLQRLLDELQASVGCDFHLDRLLQLLS